MACRWALTACCANVTVAAGTRIDAFSLMDDAAIGEANRLGPFSRIRPGTVLARDVHVGNFVEIKNSQIDNGSKINHLSYIGDTTMGKKVNIGAGTITCNYDGANKHRTVIEDDVFVGSDTQLVAPVTVGKGATLGAGTTLTKDAPGRRTDAVARQTDHHHAAGSVRSNRKRKAESCAALSARLRNVTSCPSCWKACGGSNIAAMTRPGWSSSTTACSGCAASAASPR